MSLRRLAASALGILVAFCLSTGNFGNLVYAQSSNATLSGTVTDPSGAAIAGARLRLVNSATNSESNFQSDESGQFSFRDLQPGSYSLTATKAGFENSIQKGLVLTINASVRTDIVLKVGQQNETVEVNADTSLINYDNGTVEGGVDPQTLQDLPLAVANGAQRSSAELAILLPGVATGSGNSAYNARINGGVRTGDEALLDGATMSEGFMNQSGMVSIHGDFQFSPDMISEMKVLGSSYEPQYGNSTSGQIVVQSRSGGNSFHGAVYNYLRNDGFNAKQWGSLKRPFDQENDSGANIGGPIKLPGFNSPRNRGFFYLNWEHYKENGGATQPTLSIPSLKERSGDFTDWGHPIYDPTTGQQFSCNGVLNVICPNLEDPIAKAWLAQLPSPTNGGTQNNYLVPHAVPSTLLTGTNVWFFRIDDNFGNNDHFYYTYYRQWAIQNVATALPLALSSSQPADIENAPIQRFNWEHILSPTMTNHFTFGYLNRNEDYYALNSTAKAGLPSVPGVANSTFLPQFNFSGWDQWGNNYGPPGHNKTTRPTWAINDIASRVIRSHTLVAGIEWRSAEGNLHRATNQGGTFTFTGATTANPSVPGSGNSVADLFIGAANSGNVTYYNVPDYYPRQTAWAAHFGDTWRATPKLTLTYGLRWDMETPSREKYNHFSFFDATLPNPAADNRFGALAFATDARPYPEHLGKSGFAPRLGAAYSVGRDTVIRAGYGIFYGQAFYPGWNAGMNLDGYNTNFTANSAGLNASGQATPGVCLSPGNVFCAAGGFPTPSTAENLSPSFDNGQNPLYRPLNGNERPRSQQWNLTIEHQFPSNLFVSAAYVGNRGSHLLSLLAPANVLSPTDPRVIADAAILQQKYTGQVPEPYPGWANDPSIGCKTVAQALLPYPQFCGTLQGLNESLGSSSYNSFQLRAEHRFHDGIYMLLSYTNSKLVEDASSDVQSAATTWSGSDGVISPFERQRARTLAPDDVPQLVSAAFVYDLPFGQTRRFLHTGGVVNAIVGGWEVSPVIRYSRGIPFFFRSGSCNISGTLREACIPGLLPGIDPFLQDPNHFNPGAGPLFNINAFEPVANFATPNYSGYGNRISDLRGPNYKDVSLSFTKNTRITERVNFRISANFFNAFNAHYFLADEFRNLGGDTAFNNDISKSNFGSWNGTVSSPRTIQFAGRIEF